MALPYLDLYKLAGDAAFQQRVQFALWRSANVVMREDVNTPNHTARLAWAKDALRGPAQDMTSIVNRIATTGAVFNNGASVDDTQLQNIVDTILNDIVGV